MNFFRNKKNERGFTLTELLVVIAIIGILASVVFASLSSARVKGRDAKRTSDIKQIQLALEFYYDANSNEYPDAGTIEADLVPTFIGSLPRDPSTSNLYDYEVDGANSVYVLRASLEQDEDVLNEDIDDSTDLDPGFTTDCSDASPDFYFCVGP